MKRLMTVLAVSALLPLAGMARAEDKPDCSAPKAAVDEAVTASKAKPDLSACKEMKGKEKSDCEKPIKDKAKEDAKAAKDKVKDAKKAFACCQNPKKKGCS